MSDIVTFLRNYDYSIALAKGSKWTLEEAIDYLAAYRANNQRWLDREDAYKGFLNVRAQITVAVQNAIDSGWLHIDDVFNGSVKGETSLCDSAVDLRRSTVLPIIFIKWAIDSNINVPKQFKEYADRNKGNKALYYEKLEVKRSTVHHERCRAIAELLWRLEPDIPIAEMARRKEIIEIGCEGQNYDMRTISRWLASLKPDRRPGQPRKKEGLTVAVSSLNET